MLTFSLQQFFMRTRQVAARFYCRMSWFSCWNPTGFYAAFNYCQPFTDHCVL